jgi:hypothetical protein
VEKSSAPASCRWPYYAVTRWIIRSTSRSSSRRLSKHNRAILTQMKTMTRQMQTLTAELERMPKLGIWNAIQSLSAGVQEMLEADMTPRLR